MKRTLAILLQVITMTLPLAHHSGVPDSVVAEIAAIYDQVAARISADVVNFVAREGTRSQEFKRARAAEITARMEAHLRQFGRALQRPVIEASKASYALGLSQGRTQLQQLNVRIEGVPAQGSFALVDRGAVETLARDVVIASMTAAQDLAESARRVTRAIAATQIADADASRAIARGIASGDPRQAKREVRELFRQPGDEESYRKLGNRIITVGRANMTIRAYSETLVRTRTREAVVHARHEQLTRHGVDLVIIDGRISKNFCTRYIGLICSLGGDHPRWPAISSLPGGGPPFHPNCSKSTRPYIEHLASDRETNNGQRALREFEDQDFGNREPLDPTERQLARGRLKA